MSDRGDKGKKEKTNRKKEGKWGKNRRGKTEKNIELQGNQPGTFSFKDHYFYHRTIVFQTLFCMETWFLFTHRGTMF